MNNKLNRRTLGKTAGVLAGGSVAARVTPVSAQDTTPEATPAGSPVAMDAVEQILSAWPDVPREVAETVMTAYGPPQEATPSRLIWFDNAPWKRTILYRDVVQHDFPMPHPDLLEQVIDYQAPPDTYDDLARYDGSVIVERTKGEMSARCDKEPMNFLAINLANDVATGARTADEARQFYAETAMAFMEGMSDPYVEGFVFEVSQGGTADPDQPAM
ncbi:MAG: hypothetical protein AVDCRST_MAG33-379 [uncultured Thermomicrobiales bacterium]|uniref:Uncharacterized protein n=1 Tax=uncultured Thermomicrobiales bacterium TaxID=1645740 RepID=A0A6J4UD12_9BACT|nr:MAG: hypothetical protein AVDCRST_MAG33-379 [uncultured Thermomicrobiales bacterium]